MKKAARFYHVLLPLLFLFKYSISQSVGIGTTNPNSKAILEIRSTDKGILFPRLTTAQRDAIANAPNGLHIFNTDEHCINFYDSVYQVWNCYCADCQVVVINISSNACKVDFYNSYARNMPAKKYLINIAAGVTVSGCSQGDTALSFSNMIAAAEITINNYGTIAGAGGKGGNAAINQGCFFAGTSALPGLNGGAAVAAKAGVVVRINNYGIVAGGGGGGGGSGGTTISNYGGGGGGGAGIVGGAGGTGGGVFVSSPIVGCVGAISYSGQPGVTGQSIIGGTGGAGFNGGNTGGAGGDRGEAGQNGTSFGNPVQGGSAGKAITGGSGNSINNISGGQSFGIVD